MTKRHENFQDPRGLIARMIRSGHPAAHSALVREVVRYLVYPLDLVLGWWERRRVRAAAEPSRPIVLIVGSPRSGSTLLYQVLTAHLSVSYPTNLTELFAQSPITATARFARFARRKHFYASYYGQTASFGSPSDAFSLWNRWLGTDRYHAPDMVDEPTGAGMRSFFGAWETAFEAPFLNKNNRNTFAVSLLARQLPTSRFIVCRRDPVFTAQSLVEARENVQGDRSIGWGLAATAGLDGKDHLVAVAEQVSAIESTLEQQLASVPADRIFEVEYRKLCAEPASVVTAVADWIGLTTRDLDRLQPFRSADTIRLGPTDFARLTAEVSARLSQD